MNINYSCFIFNLIAIFNTCKAYQSENDALEYIQSINSDLNRLTNILQEAQWNYDIDKAAENREILIDATDSKFQYFKSVENEILKYDWRHFKNHTLKRQFKFLLSNIGYSVLPSEEFDEINKMISNMISNHVSTRICYYTDKQNCTREPGVLNIVESGSDPEEMKYYWQQYFDKAGTGAKQYFGRYVELKNKAAKLKNFKSGAEEWLSLYEDNSIEKQIDGIYNDIKPLYAQLHGYVRWNLRKKYGYDIVSETKPIPIHLLNNFQGEIWSSVGDIMKPYPNKLSIDITDEMKAQNYNVFEMFKLAEHFFTSMNMSAMPDVFWKKSLLEKQNDTLSTAACNTASTTDFFSIDDARIKMCAEVKMEDLFIIFHELGHIEYCLQYQNQPFSFRDGANPGFHEAIGDVISLSVKSPKFLKRIRLSKDYQIDEESQVNELFNLALYKLVFLPYSISLDKYRWGVFWDDINLNQWNCAYWKIRSKYSGIEPPALRSEYDFDITTKIHVSRDMELLRYAVSIILEYQFFESLCKKAGQFDPKNSSLPLYNCDLYGNTEVGNLFKNMLALGAFKPWPDAMKLMTGKKKMLGRPILDYFKPLHDWLVKKQKEENYHIGWDETNSKILQKIFK